MFIKENIDQKYLEPLFIYMVVSTLLGARLGEVFFYNWDYFQNNLITITAILSFMGLIPMISGLYKRQKNSPDWSNFRGS